MTLPIRHRSRAALLSVAAIVALGSLAIARPPQPDVPAAPTKEPAKDKPAPDKGAAGDDAKAPPTFVQYPDKPSVTHGSVTINGATVDYEATAGTLTLVDDQAKPKARLFYVSYRRTMKPHEEFERELDAWKKKHSDDKAAAGEEPTNFPPARGRPITFSFNGGPGSSSVWLHLGLYGPRRVNAADEMGNPGPPPYRVVPNEFSLLDKSDFVFIDPVSTGYSRAEEPSKAGEFHGVEPDAESVSEFIRRFLARERRWSSPKFITGESYGTTRAAALSRQLMDEHGISLNGIILVSAVLEFQTIRFDAGNDEPYISYLPSYAATAQFHKKLQPPLQALPTDELYARAKAFAEGEYAAALRQGDVLPAAERARIAARVAEFTGISPVFIERARLRVSLNRFAKELLRDQGKTVGRLDARFTGLDRDDAGDGFEYDASYAAIRSIYTESFNAYVREELGFESDLPYEILNNLGKWDSGPSGDGRYLNVAERLRFAMNQQPYLKVFLAGGYHDLATPLAGAEDTFDHLPLSPERRANIQVHHYHGGHMMYVDRGSLAKLKKDLDAFYDSAVAAK